MDVHEMLAVVVSDSDSRARRTSTEFERNSTPTPTSQDASTFSPFAAVARHSLDMGSTAPVSIPRHSLDLPKATDRGAAGYSLSRMLSGSIFPTSLSRTSTAATYPSTRGSPSPPLSPSSAFAGRIYNTFSATEGGTWTADKAATVPELPQPRAAKLAGGLARCLADLSNMDHNMVHMDHMDPGHERHSH